MPRACLWMSVKSPEGHRMFARWGFRLNNSGIFDDLMTGRAQVPPLREADRTLPQLNLKAINMTKNKIVFILTLNIVIMLGQIQAAHSDKSTAIHVYVNPKAKQYVLKKVVILPFVYPVQYDKFATKIETLLKMEIEKINKYGLVSRRQVSAQLKRKKISRSQLLSYPYAIKIAESLDADGVITGSVSYSDDMEVSFNTRLISAHNAEIMWSLSARKNSKETEHKLVRIAFKELIQAWLAASDILATGIITPPIKVVESLKEINLSWQASPANGIDRYILYKGDTKDKPVQRFKTFYADTDKKVYEFEDSNLLEGVTYYYQYRIVTDAKFVSVPSPLLTTSLKLFPQTPQKFKAVSGLHKKVELKWTANREPDLEGYKIYRSLKKKGGYVLIKDISSPDEEDYTDEDLYPGVTYYYKLSAYYDETHESRLTRYVAATTNSVPSAPAGLQATDREVQQVKLLWKENAEKDIKDYTIWRSRKKHTDFRKIETIPSGQTIFIDRDLGNNAVYYYKIQAIDNYGLASGFSDTIKGATRPLPAPPKGVIARGATGKIILTWHPNSEKEIVGYTVYRKTWLGSKTLGTVSAAFYEDMDVSSGDTHEYQVIAVDKDGLESGKSVWVKATVR